MDLKRQNVGGTVGMLMIYIPIIPIQEKLQTHTETGQTSSACSEAISGDALVRCLLVGSSTGNRSVSLQQ